MKAPSREIWMVRPDYFDIAYVINPHMQNPDGSPKKVDRGLAIQQWKNVHQTFLNLGWPVQIIDPIPGLPDMVFCANPVFPFFSGKKAILSEMKSAFRKGEVSFFESFLKSHGFEVQILPWKNLGFSFEGMGDALWDFEGRWVWGGHGFRTDPEVYPHLSHALDRKVIPLRLIDENFYHLDTCFSVLGPQTVALVMEAIDPLDLRTVRSKVPNVIEITKSEALNNFAGNCFSLDGKSVVLQKGSLDFCAKLKSNGFQPIEVDTSEFIKAGGSVFCMKLVVPTIKSG